MRYGKDEEKEEKLITELGEERADLSFIFKNAEDVGYINNYGKTFYAQDIGGKWYERKIAYKEQEEPVLRELVSYSLEAKTERVLRSRKHRSGLVVETFSKVLLLNSQGLTTLLDEQVLSVRAFQRSKRYKDLITVTTERGIWLISIFDERRLSPPPLVIKDDWVKYSSDDDEATNEDDDEELGAGFGN